MLDRYLEKAYMAGLPFVRIIHGKGTGKLRQEVRAVLRDASASRFVRGGRSQGRRRRRHRGEAGGSIKKNGFQTEPVLI